MLRVFIGYDPGEHAAWQCAIESLKARASGPVAVSSIDLARNEAWGLMQRPWRIYRGGIWDVPSGAPAATQFAASRFLTPLLAQEGWALFVDCDVVFHGDVLEVLRHADPRYAVQVVKHRYVPTETTKMVGQPQLPYPRKNWSSVMLFNCDHPANRRLTLEKINSVPGRDLHAFCWLEDAEVGELPPQWNWLVNVQPEPAGTMIAHYTLGGPWLPGWQEAPNDDQWINCFRSVVGPWRADQPSAGEAPGEH